MKLRVVAVGKRMPNSTIIAPEDWITVPIDPPIHVDPVEFAVTFTVRAESKEPLLNAKVVVSPAIGSEYYDTREERTRKGLTGVSGDVTVIDVATLQPLKSIPVGRFPWGVIVVE